MFIKLSQKENVWVQVENIVRILAEDDYYMIYTNESRGDPIEVRHNDLTEDARNFLKYFLLSPTWSMFERFYAENN